MIRNIVFDMGNVLMRYHPLETCRAAAADEEGAQTLNSAIFGHPEWAGLDDDSIPLAEFSRRVMKRLPTPELRAQAESILSDLPGKALTPIPGMEALLQWVRGQGFQLYLLSNAAREFSQERHIVPGIDLFTGVLFSADEKLVKPDAAIYHKLMERFSLAPQECFFVDDLAPNIEGALRVGWQAYQFDGNIEKLQSAISALQ